VGLPTDKLPNIYVSITVSYAMIHIYIPENMNLFYDLAEINDLLFSSYFVVRSTAYGVISIYIVQTLLQQFTKWTKDIIR
jgi:hypothetical protein